MGILRGRERAIGLFPSPYPAPEADYLKIIVINTD
jgi:hypothetical protein